MTRSTPVDTLQLHHDMIKAFIPGFQSGDPEVDATAQQQAIAMLGLLKEHDRHQFYRMATGFLQSRNIAGINTAELHEYAGRNSISCFFSSHNGVTMRKAIDLLTPPRSRAVFICKKAGQGHWYQVDYSRRSISGAFALIDYPQHRLTLRKELDALKPFIPKYASIDMVEIFLERGERIGWRLEKEDVSSFSMTVDAINARILILDKNEKSVSIADLIGALRNSSNREGVDITRQSYALAAARYQPSFNFIIPKQQDISQPALQLRRRSR